MAPSSSSSPRRRSRRTQSATTTTTTTTTQTEAKASTHTEHDDGETSSSSSPRSLLMEWMTHQDESFHYFSQQEAIEIRQALLQWYYANRRKLPWRGDPPPYNGSTAARPKSKVKDKTQSNSNSNNKNCNNYHERTPYGVWVSEIMLQQTRVEAVIPYWISWMKVFPSIEDLANATSDEVNAQWAGLGFYRRARLLHTAAKYVCDNYEGVLPQTPEELQRIPGIGPYTAAAIASICFDVCVPVVDGNVCRVLSRLRGIAHHIKAPILKDKVGWTLAGQIVRAAPGMGSPGDVNQALMELGATYCAPSGTGIDPNDPLRDYYWSTKLGAEYYQHVILTKTNTTLSSSSSSSLIASTVQSFMDGNDDHDDFDDDETKRKQKQSSSSCPLCDRERMRSLLHDLDTSIHQRLFETSSSSSSQTPVSPIDHARMAGHSVFPTSPPKQTKREEVLAVAVLSTTTLMTASNNDNGDDNDKTTATTYWLLTKRPEKGLLAGQWEFPSTVVWDNSTNSSDPNDNDKNGKKKPTTTKKKNNSSSSSSPSTKNGVKKRKLVKSEAVTNNNNNGGVPVVERKERKRALRKLLNDIALSSSSSSTTANSSSRSSDVICNANLSVLNSTTPIEHIFSHIRHTMWVEHATVDGVGLSPSSSTTTSHHLQPEPLEWTSSSTSRLVRWMTESDMKAYGVTAGVKKVLKAVQQERQQAKNKEIAAQLAAEKKRNFFQPRSKKRK